jgi:1A family penicillin-binding protein
MRERSTPRHSLLTPASKKGQKKTSLLVVSPKAPITARERVKSSLKPENRRERLQKAPMTKGRRFFAWLKRQFTWRRILGGFLTFTAVIVLAAVGAFVYFGRDLPNPNTLQERQIAQATQIYDRKGETNLYSLYGEENRTIVPSDQISDYVKQATISIEDKTFYIHQGYSLKGITRSVVARLIPGWRPKGGGSTITQQYIKNVYDDRETTAARKLRELILAVEIERIYSKEEILAGYLNQIPYGNNAYGIEAGARTYFNKSAKDLTLSEAATLAAIPQAPSRYNPYGANTAVLFGRKNYILDQMAADGFITEEQAEAAKGEAPNAENQSFQDQGAKIIAPHFVFFVRDQLLEIIKEQSTDTTTPLEKQLDEAGWKVITSVDLDMQRRAEVVVREEGEKAVRQYRATNAALTAVDPKSGEVLAMVGSIDYNDKNKGKNNYATAKKQPGSSWKPFVFAASFRPGSPLHPGSTLFDVETDFGGGYKPNNYNGSFSGPVTVRQALGRSLNIPAVKGQALTGEKKVIDLIREMGISTVNPDGGYGLSMALGTPDVRNVEMANAFAVFANGGNYHQLRPILRIERRDGSIVKDFTTNQPKQVLEPEVAWQVANIMADNDARSAVFGTRSQLVLPGRTAAAKTGTTQNYRDGWTVGYTPSLVTAVWVGNDDDGKTMTSSAATAAAPLWNRFMREALDGKPNEDFQRPGSLKETTLDRLSGKFPTDQSPTDQRVTEWLADWQIPQGDNRFDDIHIVANVNRDTGKLAGPLTLPDLIERRTYFKIRSEKPTDPNWENPVQAWAAANGGGNPPTDTEDLYIPGNQPTVSVSGRIVGGKLELTADAGGARGIRNVVFSVAGTDIVVDTSPFTTLVTIPLTPGETISFRATATNDLSLQTSADGSLTVPVDAPVATISSLVVLQEGNSLLGTPTRLQAVVTTGRTNSLRVFRSTSASEAGLQVQTVTATAAGSYVIELPATNDQSGQSYWFSVRAITNDGAEGALSVRVGPVQIK